MSALLRALYAVSSRMLSMGYAAPVAASHLEHSLLTTHYSLLTTHYSAASHLEHSLLAWQVPTAHELAVSSPPAAATLSRARV